MDIIHGHDWQAGPALLSLRHRYAGDPLLAGTATMLTCHNLAYHGWTPRDAGLAAGPARGRRQAPDGVDLLREAIRTADIVNTVSPNYARESLTPEFGAGLDDVLRARGDRYIGIINGIDTELWDPATDATLVAPYDARTICAQGRDPRRPDGAPRTRPRRSHCSGVIGRLDPQKGFDLVARRRRRSWRWVRVSIVLGTGNEQLVAGLRRAGRASTPTASPCWTASTGMRRGASTPAPTSS